jgi:hypothetical protein
VNFYFKKEKNLRARLIGSSDEHRHGEKQAPMPKNSRLKKDAQRHSRRYRSLNLINKIARS